MAFGSYDESEQENNRANGEDIDDGTQVSLNRSENEGDIEWEHGDGTEDLLETFEEVRGSN